MRQGKRGDDGLVNQLEANDGNKGDGELVWLIVSSPDQSIGTLSWDSRDEWENHSQECKCLWDWKG